MHFMQKTFRAKPPPQSFLVGGIAFLVGVIGLTIPAVALQQPEPAIAATVANQTVTVDEANGFLGRTIDDRPLRDDVKTLLQAKALEQLVGQLLVLEYLRADNKLASDEDVQLAQERLEEELHAVEQTLEQHLAAQRLTRSGLANRIRFQLSWKRYLDALLTEENLKKHFEKFRREMDDGQMRVSHLLLKTSDAALDDMDTIRVKAEQVRQQVVDGKIAWSDAVQSHSQAATRESAGDIGWIGRFAPMPESFSAAAFKLEPGQISATVRTEFGFHIIRCEEIKPGTRSYEQAEQDIRRHATQYLFGWIVARQKEQTPPRYTGQYPHLDSTTGQVIAPTPPPQPQPQRQ